MRRSLRKANRILLALLLLGVFAAFCGNVCFAAPSGSLTLVCVWHGTDGDVPLSGDEYSLALIADAELDAQGGVRSFAVLPVFAEHDCEWSVQTASALAQKAKELQQTAQREHAVISAGSINAEGRLCFSGLSPGLYLAFRSNTAEVNKGYTVQPFLIAIPQEYPEGTDYDVTVTPKFNGPTDPGTTPKPPNPSIPKTGQLNWPIPVLSTLGGGLILIGMLMTRKKKDKEEPKS